MLFGALAAVPAQPTDRATTKRLDRQGELARFVPIPSPLNPPVAVATELLDAVRTDAAPSLIPSSCPTLKPSQTRRNAVGRSVAPLPRHFAKLSTVITVPAASSSELDRPASPALSRISNAAAAALETFVSVLLAEIAGTERAETPLHRQLTTTAQWANLPSPLALKHGPLLMTIHFLADGSVEASLPGLTVYGRGETDIDALCDFAENLLEWAQSMMDLKRAGESFVASADHEWNHFTALVNVDALGPPK